MATKAEKFRDFLEIAARLSSVAVIILITALTADRGLRFEGMSAMALLMFAFFPIGIVIGMVLGWTKPILGGSITLICALIYYTLYVIQNGTIPLGETFYVFPAPGGAFLVKGIADILIMNQSK
ncbi:hypothetical protein L21SP3_01513 [Sedimentisphaera cyanobacteriorum]|uniref:DUF7670 domain-containing protein n=1 Tax=Sedimentisphaera cyanobacteriorum TaxID=1940790 RepID=A0A1Q2HR48_9BACT|nr:hypothetical protein [Sedimentisphaera cyanobacteriorum]AQQ09703.1 hypothetical protein L21SP3_01513 [Sedimentisphaera cyanobacteriorum]